LLANMDLREFCSKGGMARAEKLSKERRKEIARKAAMARWQKIVCGEGVVRKCQSAHCDKPGKEVMVQGLKAWLCEDHG
jgi:hypothetical protein